MALEPESSSGEASLNRTQKKKRRPGAGAVARYQCQAYGVNKKSDNGEDY